MNEHSKIIRDSLPELQSDWSHYRQRLEIELGLLIVDDNEHKRKELEELCSSQHILVYAASSKEEALALIKNGTCSLVAVSEELAGLGGTSFVNHLRVTFPDVDTLFYSDKPSIELIAKAFELRSLDVLCQANDDGGDKGICQRIKLALARHIDSRMRSYVVSELRALLLQLETETRVHAITQLDQRLSSYKNSLGDFNRILLMEREDPQLRLFSEDLFLAGLQVETITELEEGLSRVSGGDIPLIILDLNLEEQALSQILSRLRQLNPMQELMLIASEPTVSNALAALRSGAMFYLPWPPSSWTAAVFWVPELLRRIRRECLLNNLLAELYHQAHAVLGSLQSTAEGFLVFRNLVGLNRVQSVAQVAVNDTDAAETSAEVSLDLEAIFDQLIAPVDEPLSSPVVIEEVNTNSDVSDRRIHHRISGSQFIRFRPESATSSTLAFLGDLGEGGLFIRTQEILSPGTILNLDFEVEHDHQAFIVRCRGQVAWVAGDNRQSLLGPGFGIKFLDLPADVSKLLEKIIYSRLSTMPSSTAP